MKLLRDILLAILVLFVASYPIIRVWCLIADIGVGIEYKEAIPAECRKCVEIDTSDRGIVYMCEKE
jgi:hypothetical protein